jgi:hypothetical protein
LIKFLNEGISEQLLSPGTLLSPSAVVRKIGKEKKVAKEKMEEIRRTALIASGLQEELLAELSGESWTQWLLTTRTIWGQSSSMQK